MCGIADYHCWPFAVETLAVWGLEAISFDCDFDTRIARSIQTRVYSLAHMPVHTLCLLAKPTIRGQYTTTDGGHNKEVFHYHHHQKDTPLHYITIYQIKKCHTLPTLHERFYFENYWIFVCVYHKTSIDRGHNILFSICLSSPFQEDAPFHYYTIKRIKILNFIVFKVSFEGNLKFI